MSVSSEIQPILRFVGALHVDEVATIQGEFVQAASNPVVWRRYLGGVGSNAARAAQAIFNSNASNRHVSFHAAIGDDNTGLSLVRKMQNEGIKTEPQFIKAHSTGRYSVVIDKSGQLVLGLADVQLAELLQPEAILSTINPQLTNMLVLDANLSPACIDPLMEAASSSSVTVAALTVSPAKAVRLLPWATRINFLFCNRREALALAIATKLVPQATDAEQLSLQQLGDALVTLGFTDFVLTDAAAALLIRCRGVFTPVQVPNINVVHNVNGAGDTLAGASLAALSLGLPLEQAVTRFGLSLAADVLGGRRLPLTV